MFPGPAVGKLSLWDVAGFLLLDMSHKIEATEEPLIARAGLVLPYEMAKSLKLHKATTCFLSVQEIYNCQLADYEKYSFYVNLVFTQQ